MIPTILGMAVIALIYVVLPKMVDRSVVRSSRRDTRPGPWKTNEELIAAASNYRKDV